MKKMLFSLVAIVTILSMLAACAAPEVVEKEVVVEKPVVQTVVVEKEVVVEKPVAETVKETVIVAGTPQVVEREVTKVVEKTVAVAPNSLTLGLWGTTSPNNFCTLGATTDVDGIWLRQLLGETLLTLNDDGTEWLPGLVERWESSDDGMSYVFTLRSDVTWHDGTPFTVQDVKFTFDLLLETKWYDEYPSAAAKNIEAVELELIDDYTLRFTMRRPIVPGDFGADSAFRTIAETIPMPWHILAPDEGSVEELCQSPWAQEAYVGLGPFQVETFEPDRQLVLVPHEGYYDGPSDLEQLVIHFELDPTEIFFRLSDGELDLGQVSPSLLPVVEEAENLDLAERTSLVAVNTDRLQWPNVDRYVYRALVEPRNQSNVPYRESLQEVNEIVGDAVLLPERSEIGQAILVLGPVLQQVRINRARTVTIVDEGETIHLAPPDAQSLPTDEAAFWEQAKKDGVVIGTRVLESGTGGERTPVPAVLRVHVNPNTDEPEVWLVRAVGQDEEVVAVLTGDQIQILPGEPVDIPIATFERGSIWCWLKSLGVSVGSRCATG